jgi:16S rRNA (adenine1518-N6/adenine1519-N6)-dimethyltransferase
MQHKARKRFGQNFLIDSSIIDRIVQSINPQAEDKLVEIGPGLGALTCPLMACHGKMDVIELDRDIIPKLRINCGLTGELNIHNMDVLKFNFADLVGDNEQLRIIGNLPYNISTPLIFHLVNYPNIIKDMHFMLQKEVVTRLAARPGTSNYSRLSVMAQYHFKVSPLFPVPPEAFNPRPKVNSAIVRLQPHREKPVAIDNEKAFASLITVAFSQRRKTLRNALKKHCSPDQLADASIDPAQRAQEISLQQFADLHRIIQAKKTLEQP